MKTIVLIAILTAPILAFADCAPIEFAEANTYSKIELNKMINDSADGATQVSINNMRNITDSFVKGIPRKQDKDDVCLANAALAKRLLAKRNAEDGTSTVEIKK